jgi:hypothetical protein
MAQAGTHGTARVTITGGAVSLAPSLPAVTLLILNLLDGLFTLTFLQLGVAEEANPLMRVVYEMSPLGFMAFKLLVVNVGVLILVANQTAPLAQWALRLATFAYAVIVTWHLAFLAWLVGR